MAEEQLESPPSPWTVDQWMDPRRCKSMLLKKLRSLDPLIKVDQWISMGELQTIVFLEVKERIQCSSLLEGDRGMNSVGTNLRIKGHDDCSALSV
jgi:hypothetical protein